MPALYTAVPVLYTFVYVQGSFVRHTCTNAHQTYTLYRTISQMDWPRTQSISKWIGPKLANCCATTVQSVLVAAVAVVANKPSGQRTSFWQKRNKATQLPQPLVAGCCAQLLLIRFVGILLVTGLESSKAGRATQVKPGITRVKPAAHDPTSSDVPSQTNSETGRCIWHCTQ